MALLLAMAPAVLALSDPGHVVGKFQGVWISGAYAQSEPQRSTATARKFDVVIRETKTGFEMSWKRLGGDEAGWITARFVAGAEPGSFEVRRAEPALSLRESLSARIEGDRLVVHLSVIGNDGVERTGRYEHSLVDARLAFKYTFTQDGEVLDSASGTLWRAKIVL